MVHDGIASPRDIVLGARSVRAIEVVQGLREGDQAVVSGAEHFADQAQVKIYPSSSRVSNIKNKTSHSNLLHPICGNPRISRSIHNCSSRRVRSGHRTFRVGKSDLLEHRRIAGGPARGSDKLAGNEVRDLSDNQRSRLRNEKLGFIFQGFNLIADRVWLPKS